MTRSRRSERSWWIWPLVAVGVVGLSAFVVVVGLVVVPPLLANLRTQVASVETPLVLGPEGASVAIAVPTGWLVTPQDDRHVTISTPDRGMTVEATLADTAPEQAAGDAGAQAPLGEPLASGLTVVHGPVAPSEDAGASASVRLVAAVGPVDGRSVVFAVSSDDLERYRPALAELVEAVRP